MEDERVRNLLERVTNFNWEPSKSGEARTEFEKRRAELIELWRKSTDEAEKARLWSMYKAPVPIAVSAEWNENAKRFRKFRSELLRDFPEWHHSDGSRVQQFVGGEGGGESTIQPEIRNVWELASSGEVEKAKRKLRKMAERFSQKAERALSTKASWYGLAKREKEAPQRSARPKEAATLRQMVETLEWLQGRLRSLKVCENPKCSSGRRYFFKVYNNDRYCSGRCTTIAKALRQAKRDAGLQKAKRPPAFTEEHRRNMSIAQQERWERQRAKTGKRKYARS